MFARFRAALAAAAVAVLAVGCGASIVPQIHNDSSRIPVARQMYAKGEYGLAVEVLTPYLQSGAGNADIDQAVYLLGLAYLKEREWTNAQAQFERMVRDYPESDSSGAAAFRLGESLYGQARDYDFDQEYTLRAMNQWESFRKSYPDHPLLPQADVRIAECRTRLARKLWRTGDMYVKLKLYQPAEIYFRNVLGEYSDTPVYGDALLGLAVSQARLGHKDSALTVLQGLEKDFAGRPLGLQASRTRARVEKWPAEGDRPKRGHRPVESETPAPAPAPSQGTKFAP